MELLIISIGLFILLMMGIGSLMFVIVRLTHLNNAINKRIVFMLVQQNDVLGQFANHNIGDLEKNVDAMQNIIRGIDKQKTPEENKAYDPFKDGDVT